MTRDTRHRRGGRFTDRDTALLPLLGSGRSPPRRQRSHLVGWVAEPVLRSPNWETAEPDDSPLPTKDR